LPQTQGAGYSVTPAQAPTCTGDSLRDSETSPRGARRSSLTARRASGRDLFLRGGRHDRHRRARRAHYQRRPNTYTRIVADDGRPRPSGRPGPVPGPCSTDATPFIRYRTSAPPRWRRSAAAPAAGAARSLAVLGRPVTLCVCRTQAGLLRIWERAEASGGVPGRERQMVQHRPRDGELRDVSRQHRPFADSLGAGSLGDPAVRDKASTPRRRSRSGQGPANMAARPGGSAIPFQLRVCRL